MALHSCFQPPSLNSRPHSPTKTKHMVQDLRSRKGVAMFDVFLWIHWTDTLLPALTLKKYVKDIAQCYCELLVDTGIEVQRFLFSSSLFFIFKKLLMDTIYIDYYTFLKPSSLSNKSDRSKYWPYLYLLIHIFAIKITTFDFDARLRWSSFFSGICSALKGHSLCSPQRIRVFSCRFRFSLLHKHLCSFSIQTFALFDDVICSFVRQVLQRFYKRRVSPETDIASHSVGQT